MHLQTLLSPLSDYYVTSAVNHPKPLPPHLSRQFPKVGFHWRALRSYRWSSLSIPWSLLSPDSTSPNEVVLSCSGYHDLLNILQG